MRVDEIIILVKKDMRKRGKRGPFVLHGNRAEGDVPVLPVAVTLVHGRHLLRIKEEGISRSRNGVSREALRVGSRTAMYGEALTLVSLGRPEAAIDVRGQAAAATLHRRQRRCRVVLDAELAAVRGNGAEGDGSVLPVAVLLVQGRHLLRIKEVGISLVGNSMSREAMGGTAVHGEALTLVSLGRPEAGHRRPRTSSDGHGRWIIGDDGPAW
jgi:hypothetical protein